MRTGLPKTGRPPGISRDKMEEAQRRGLSGAQAARAFDVSPAVISRACQRWGIDLPAGRLQEAARRRSDPAWHAANSARLLALRAAPGFEEKRIAAARAKPRGGPITREMLEAGRAAGLCAAEVARQHGRSSAAVRAACARLGVDLPDGRPKAARQTVRLLIERRAQAARGQHEEAFGLRLAALAAQERAAHARRWG